MSGADIFGTAVIQWDKLE